MDTYDKKYMVEYCVSGVSILLMSLVGVIDSERPVGVPGHGGLCVPGAGGDLVQLATVLLPL